jgi:hypothetical protein
LPGTPLTWLWRGGSFVHDPNTHLTEEGHVPLIAPIRSRHAGIALLLLLLASGGRGQCGEVEELTPADREVLRRYARDTWKSMAAMADGSELPSDSLRLRQDGSWMASPKTTPTDIAAYLWSTLAAQRLGIITQDEATARISRIVTILERIERVHGFFYDAIDPQTGRPLRKSPYTGMPMGPIVSSVDNGWMATGLIIVANTQPSLRIRAGGPLRAMDFGFFFVPFDPADPARHPGLLQDPYVVDRKSFGGFLRILNTEQRIGTYIGIARGQIPREHYFRPGRTLDPSRREQSQRPEGVERTYQGIRVFEGHYRYRAMRIVPSWGGSMFEALMVTLFVPEEKWAPRSWGVNHPLYVRAQIEHGLQEAQYGFWGFSPASNPEGGYRTYGVDALGADPRGYRSNNDDRPAGAAQVDPSKPWRNGVVTPHASFLALRFAPRAAMDNLAKIKESFSIYSEYGFRDSVNVSSGVVCDTVLALDQGMIMAAIANALADDAMRHAFSDGDFELVIRPLIEPEEFTAGEDPPMPH